MPPAKSSRNNDDSKSDAASANPKNGTTYASTKMRRIASQTGGSQLREVANAPTSAAAQVALPAQAPTLDWTSFDRDVLLAYRREHNLSLPTCYTHAFHKSVLSNEAGIGVHSPSMKRSQRNRRLNEDYLARTLRKHFNRQGIQENDVIVDFIHKVRSENSAKADGPNRQTAATSQ